MLISLGIYQPWHLRRLRPGTFLGRRRKFAMDLIDEVERSEQEALRRAFIESLVDGIGVSKRTYSNRFPAFDGLLTDILSKSSPAGPIRVLDVAVSDGSTSLNLFRQLKAAIDSNVRLTATDRDGRYFVLRQKADTVRRVIVSPHGEVVQVVWPPFVFGSRANENVFLFPANRAFRYHAVRFATDLLKKWQNDDPQIQARELLFLSSEFRKALLADPNLEFVLWDIMTPWTGGKAHCVRAMNILNPQYFSHDHQSKIIANLFAAVADGGVLAMGSNDDPCSEVDGVICRRYRESLIEVASSGNGFRCRRALAGFMAAG
jgi:chemotaxis methyl-accepting protein methylase